jgi:hypothetical protein
MTRYCAFNGDADGLCALQQLRLSGVSFDVLVTGVKRDIELVGLVAASAGDSLTVLDISLDKNRSAVEVLLSAGATVHYFDHHFAGELPLSERFTAMIDESPAVCTSTLVNRHLHGAHSHWAIVAAFGDNLPKIGDDMAREQGLGQETVSRLRTLGVYLNYNAYGDDVSDLHFDPADLAEKIAPYANPLDFIGNSEVYAALSDGYASDFSRAAQLKPVSCSNGAAIVVFPEETWAKRVIGVYANDFVRNSPGQALAVLSPNAQGGFVVSVRVPDDGRRGADAFCRDYPGGGGRKLAAGINHLSSGQVDAFVGHFQQTFGQV